MSTNAIAVSLGRRQLTGGFVPSENLVTNATETKKEKAIYLTDNLSLASVICEAAQIQPLLFFMVNLISVGVFLDLLLFLSRNNYLLHPYLSFSILVATVGLVNTFLTGGRVLSKFKNV